MGTILYSQNIEVTYKVVFKPNTAASNFKTEYMKLQVNGKKSYFYNANAITPETQEEKQDYLRLIVEKDIPSKNLWYYGNLEALRYKFRQPLDMKWKLSHKKDSIAGYLVQEAFIDFEDRKWKAYYTEAIPVQDGPYKFSGLPGLIVSLQSLDGDYIFELVELKNVKQEEAYKISANYIEVKRSVIDNKISKFIKDPAGENIQLTNDYNDVYEYEFKGKNSKSYISTTEMLRKRIQKYNNPIDKKTYIVIP